MSDEQPADHEARQQGRPPPRRVDPYSEETTVEDFAAVKRGEAIYAEQPGERTPQQLARDAIAAAQAREREQHHQ